MRKNILLKLSNRKGIAGMAITVAVTLLFQNCGSNYGIALQDSAKVAVSSLETACVDKNGVPQKEGQTWVIDRISTGNGTCTDGVTTTSDKYSTPTTYECKDGRGVVIQTGTPVAQPPVQQCPTPGPMPGPTPGPTPNPSPNPGPMPMPSPMPMTPQVTVRMDTDTPKENTINNLHVDSKYVDTVRYTCKIQGGSSNFAEGDIPVGAQTIPLTMTGDTRCEVTGRTNQGETVTAVVEVVVTCGTNRVKNGAICTDVVLPYTLAEDKGALVCDGFGTNTSTTAKGGLRATMKYLTKDEVALKETQEYNDKVFTRTSDYYQPGVGIDPKRVFYFSSISVTPRGFENGFTSGDGGKLKTVEGEILVEYFSLRYETAFKLGPNDEEGNYELASLADDGAVVEIFENGSWSTLVDNDTQHHQRFRCADRSIHLNRDSKIPMRVTYFQGPRTYISNMLMMRKASDVRDPECDADGGNDYFYDRSGTQPQQPFLNLLQNGWKVAADSNFQLPNDEVNPCATLTEGFRMDGAPFITNVSGTSVDIGFKFTMNGNLNVRVYKLTAIGEVEVTGYNNASEQKQHTARISDLSKTEDYKLVVRSQSTEGQRQLSFQFKLTAKK